MLLHYIFLILLFSILIIYYISNINFIKYISLIVSAIVFIFSSIIFSKFNCNQYYFQNNLDYNIGLNFLNINFSLNLDSLSLLFFLLSSFLIFLCTLFLWDNQILVREYAIVLLILDLFLLLIFSIVDLLLFYIFFEAILIPMYLVIGVWGSRQRKIRAVYLFFFYTLIGSLCMLIALTYIYLILGTFNFEIISMYSFSYEEQHFLWLAFFLSFATKIPIFPFHIWLPEAHVEAPTIGSVLLAGILLKLGVYGFLRYSIFLFPDASLYFSPLVSLLCILGVVYGSLSAIRQTDIKRIIAYSSVAHMNLVTLGIFSFNILGVEGSILQSISHGFVSGAMFLLIGILYNRYHSRALYYFSGLTHTMPIYSTFLLIFTLANIAFPGTSSFIGEFLLLCGIYKTNNISGFFSAISVILCGAYSFWLYNRIVYGNLKISSTLIFKDLNYKELSILLPLAFLVLFLGIYPNFLLNYIHLASYNLCLITLI